MDKLEKAFESFSKHIKDLTSEEIEERLRKLETNSYSGVTMDELCLLNELSLEYRFHTEVINGGWFYVNTPYFRTVSHFFTHQYLSDDDTIVWDSDPPPQNNIKEPIINNPQNKFVGFLFI